MDQFRTSKIRKHTLEKQGATKQERVNWTEGKSYHSRHFHSRIPNRNRTLLPVPHTSRTGRYVCYVQFVFRNQYAHLLLGNIPVPQAFAG